jgi:hypothetical protein
MRSIQRSLKDFLWQLLYKKPDFEISFTDYDEDKCCVEEMSQAIATYMLECGGCRHIAVPYLTKDFVEKVTARIEAIVTQRKGTACIITHCKPVQGEQIRSISNLARARAAEYLCKSRLWNLIPWKLTLVLANDWFCRDLWVSGGNPSLWWKPQVIPLRICLCMKSNG